VLQSFQQKRIARDHHGVLKSQLSSSCQSRSSQRPAPRSSTPGWRYLDILPDSFFKSLSAAVYVTPAVRRLRTTRSAQSALAGGRKKDAIVGLMNPVGEKGPGITKVGKPEATNLNERRWPAGVRQFPASPWLDSSGTLTTAVVRLLNGYANHS
jgi:hypothetical protein